MKTRILGLVAVGAMLGATLANTGFTQERRRGFDTPREELQERRGRGPGAFVRGPARGRGVAVQPERFIARHDEDGDGRVSASEFVEARLGTVERLFERRDADGDGLISAEEQAGPHRNSERGEAFEDSDTNGDGMLSLAELSAALEARAQARFTCIDADGDGFLTATEVAAQAEEGRRNPPRLIRDRAGEQRGR